MELRVASGPLDATGPDPVSHFLKKKLLQIFYHVINIDHHRIDDNNGKDNGATTALGLTTTTATTRDGIRNHDERGSRCIRTPKLKYVFFFFFFFFFSYFSNNNYLQQIDYEPPSPPYRHTTKLKEPTRQYKPSFGPRYFFKKFSFFLANVIVFYIGFNNDILTTDHSATRS